MAETNEQAFVQMTPKGKEDLGTIEIAPDVITVIAGIATSEVEGIAGMRGNFAAGVVEKLGKKVHGKGHQDRNYDGWIIYRRILPCKIWSFCSYCSS